MILPRNRCTSHLLYETTNSSMLQAYLATENIYNKFFFLFILLPNEPFMPTHQP